MYSKIIILISIGIIELRFLRLILLNKILFFINTKI
jgi:hypothetical protein